MLQKKSEKKHNMKVYSIGETVLDIIFKDNQPISAKAGGSVLNSSVSMGRLGMDVKFISDYGKDNAGKLIDSFLMQNSVNTHYVSRFDKHQSALALAFLDENNDASYTFYKDFPEKRLEGLSVNFSREDYLLFGSFFAISESVRESLFRLLNDAHEAGTTIIYDPNFRKPHLHELQKVMPYIIENIRFADIVKGSDEDFDLIFDAGNPDAAFEKIMESGCENLIFTSGAGNVSVRTPEIIIDENVPSIEPVSTIGAGDNFNAGIVYSLWSNKIHKQNLKKIPVDLWGKIVQNGISFAADVCLSYDNYISCEFASGIINRDRK